MAYIGRENDGFGVRNRFIYTATGGQTTFNTDDSGNALSYADGAYVDVYLNGVLLDPADYTATSLTSIVLDSGATASDILEVIVYDVFSVFSGTFTNGITANTATITGNLTGVNATLTTTDNSDNLTLTSTDADASSGPNVKLYRNSASPADGDALGFINFYGENDAGEETLYGQIRASIADASDGTEDARFIIQTAVAGTQQTSRIELKATETVINEDSKDLDFRVESDNNANALLVQGSDGFVGVNVSGPTVPLEVKGAQAYASSASNLSTSTTKAAAKITGSSDASTSLFFGSITNDAEQYIQSANGAGSAADDLALNPFGGKVGIGVTPVRLLHVHEGSTNDAEIHMTNTSSGATATDGLTIFANEGSAGILYRENSPFRFFTSGSEMGRFESTGELCVGTTGTSGKIFIDATGSSKPCVFSLASNTSYSGVIHRLRCATSASAAFYPIFVESGNGADAEFYVRGDGEVRADGSIIGGGADYAEMFEWEDGNSDNEDRRGFSVVLTDGNKIRKATGEDAAADIIGIVSANPSVVGDTASMKWDGKYLKDNFGNYIFESYTTTQWTEPAITNEEGEVTQQAVEHSYETDKIPSDVTVPKDAVVSDKNADGVELKRRKLNPEYDDTKTYIPRDERQEWDAIGMVGKLRMRSGQPTGDRWIKMRDITSDTEEWLVR